MECDDDSVTDALVSKGWRIGTGSRMTQAGSFALQAGAVTIQGNLGRVLAEGKVKARTRDCLGDGFWEARKRSI